MLFLITTPVALLESRFMPYLPLLTMVLLVILIFDIGPLPM